MLVNPSSVVALYLFIFPVDSNMIGGARNYRTSVAVVSGPPDSLDPGICAYIWKREDRSIEAYAAGPSEDGSMRKVDCDPWFRLFDIFYKRP